MVFIRQGVVMNLNSVAFAFMAMILCGCRVDVQPSEPEKLYYYTRPPERSIYGDTIIEVKRGDEIYCFVKKILSENQKGWVPSLVSYAPRIRIYSEGYILDIREDILILNYREKDRGRQVVKRMSGTAYDEIRKIIEPKLKRAEDEPDF